MLSLNDHSLKMCDGIPRREAIRIGGLSAVGLTLPHLLSLKANANPQESSPNHSAASPGFGKAKSVILFWLLGGAPQHESWDPKPQAPSQIRGEFGSIPTVVPGINIGELMPRTASHVDKLAILRAVVTKDQAHSSSGYQMLTGVPHIPLSQENVTSKAPNLSPSHAAMMRVLRPDSDGLPSSIALPYHIANDGEIIWPGQKAGILGRQYDPWQLYCDPSESDFSVPDLSFPQDIAAGRFDSRRQLLEQLNRYRQQAIAVSGAHGNGLAANLVAQINPENEFEKKSQQAFELLAGNSARKAFRLHEESDPVRDRYGRYRFGQSCLLARRLVQAGVSLVQVNWTRVDGKANNGTWDTHRDHCASLKSFLMPMMDQTYSALIEDLHQQGMLEETLVVWISEFGHTPRINGNAGRDHWGNCFSIAMAGGGIQGGMTHGQSDPHAAYPVADIVTPADVTATMFHCLGHSPDTMLQDQTGRPFPLTRGSVIETIV